MPAVSSLGILISPGIRSTTGYCSSIQGARLIVAVSQGAVSGYCMWMTRQQLCVGRLLGCRGRDRVPAINNISVLKSPKNLARLRLFTVICA